MSRCTETMRMGQQGREGEGKAMAGKANDRAEPHRQGDGWQGARACEGFTSALARRPAPGQAQAAFAGPPSRADPTAIKGPVRSVRSDQHRP